MSQDSSDSGSNPTDDKFVAMVTATARSGLAISDFEPRTMLKTEAHEVSRPRFPAIDCHNHLDSLDPKSVLAIMDECASSTS